MLRSDADVSHVDANGNEVGENGLDINPKPKGNDPNTAPKRKTSKGQGTLDGIVKRTRK
jgi:hypothetical protein